VRVVTLAGVVLLAAALEAQSPQPSFRGGVELITIEASVLDGDGHPVTDLTAADFVVTVAGRARPVRQIRFHDGSLRAASDDVTTAAASTVPAAIANSADDGRIVVFAIDRDSIASGSELAMLSAAAAILDSLGPADASGIYELPGTGVSLTREHARVKEALRRMTGTRPSPVFFRDRNISWDEGLAFERKDRRAMAEVIERECYSIAGRGAENGLRNQCPPDLVEQAAEQLREGRARVQTVMSGLTSMAEQLAGLRGTKQVVLLSAGLPFGQDLLPFYNDFAEKAAAAGLGISVVHIDPPEVDAAARKMSSSAFGGRELAAGLGAIAGQAGGAFYTVGGSGAGVFTRIDTEMGNFYELAVDALPEDAMRRSLSIDVKVERPGLKVRARKSVALRPRSTAAAADRLAELLRQPTDVAEIPLLVSTYSTRGDDVGTLRLVIGAEVGNGRSSAPAEWAFAAFQEGNLVATGRQSIAGAAEPPWPVAMSAKLVPGRYRLRVAATDADGRGGIIDIPLSVGLRSGGELQISDLMLGVAVNGRLQPQPAVTAGVALSGYLEILSADPALLERVRTIFEIVPGGSAEPAKRFVMAAHSGAAATVLINNVEASTMGLAVGRYTASAIVTVDEKPVGRVSRVFEIAAAR
jgi:VWFA-related protein